MPVIGLAAGFALAIGCGPREPALTNPGVSTAQAPFASPIAPQRNVRTKWEGLAEIGTYRALGKPFLSRGHFAGRWKAEVWANAPGATEYAILSRSSRFTAGAVLVKKHREKGSGAPGPLFVMVKREVGFFPQGGDWEYLVADAEGWLEDRGPLVTCARCHAEATADWVFGLPVDARP